MSSAANTREYLVLRISELRQDLKATSLGNSTALIILARIQENKNALTILNGGQVPAFQKEASNGN